MAAWRSPVEFPNNISSQWPDGARPSVVIADDYLPMLETVSRVVAEDFAVVATVSDGLQAVTAALELDPDLVVLDITMPELNGLDAARRLRQGQSRAKVVFMSMHETADYIHAAVEAGGSAYVSKRWIDRDLLSALGHVFAGRVFAPALTALPAVAPAGAHVMELYGRSREKNLALFLGAAIRQGDVVFVNATADTRVALEASWRRDGLDLVSATRQGRYLVVDVEQDLSRVIHELPEIGAMQGAVEDLERRRLAASTPRREARVITYGELSAQLLLQGYGAEARDGELRWNRLIAGRPFLAVCGYPAGGFDAGGPESFADICAAHQIVCHSGHS